ncbi:MAG: hypothetical protein H6622_03145 [Halobacteriovoraceae bacterium]|nr:hypothetical protein [Halobacteriovoraceae bacterium]
MSEFNFTVLNNTYIFDVPGYNYAIFIKAKDNNQKNLPQATYITEQTALKIIDEKIEDDIKYVQVKMENSKTGWLEKEQLSIRQKSCEICEESKIDNSNLPISPEMQQKILNTNVFIAPPLKMTYNRNGRLENVNCPNYISSSDGSYGDIGNLLVKEITGQGHSTDRWNYFNSNEIPGLEEICPNFKTFSEIQKVNFWIWFFTAIAWDEGSCQTNVIRYDATNDTAAGELQIPESWSHRKWRGPGCNAFEEKLHGINNEKQKTINTFYMTNYKNYIPCAVEIFSGAICGFYSVRKYPLKCNGTARSPFGRHMYWEKLRSKKQNENTIISMVKQYPYCINGTKNESI